MEKNSPKNSFWNSNENSGRKIEPGLGVFLIGEDEASEIYVGLKKSAAEKIGI